MSDPTQTPPPVRPMSADDYAEGRPVRQARATAPAALADHPLRDVAIGAVVGAVALWAVPKVLDFAAGGGLASFFGGEEYEEEELELEP
jgi:hypothetical protein